MGTIEWTDQLITSLHAGCKQKQKKNPLPNIYTLLKNYPHWMLAMVNRRTSPSHPEVIMLSELTCVTINLYNYIDNSYQGQSFFYLPVFSSII